MKTSRHVRVAGAWLASAALWVTGCGQEPEPTQGADPEGANHQANHTSGANSGGKADMPNSSSAPNQTSGPGNAEPNAEPAPPAPSVCVGVRGNGPRIFAHFGALARIHEHYGTIDGVAGGSSGSISSFVTESLYANPHVFECGQESCSDRQAGARIALLFKSVAGYLEVIEGTDEMVAFQQLLPIIEAIRAEGIGALVEEERYEQARDALREILTSDDLKALVNEEVLELIAESPDASFHIDDIWSSVSGFGSFAVDSDRVLIRPGLLDFEAFAEMVGRIGSFYAAYGPADEQAWAAFLDGCAEAGRGKTWAEIAGLDAGDGSTCGEHLRGMVQTWRDAYLADSGAHDARIDDPVGLHLPALVTTSVITGQAVETWEQARQDYVGARAYDFQVDYDDVRLGYWGQAADLERIGQNPGGFDDLKTQKFMALGQGPYRVALSLSPAEPGLARALEIEGKPGVVSTGGWSDLEPALVLRNMGCDRVLLVTRRGGTEGFGAQVSRLLGMTDAQNDQLFSTAQGSSVALSLEEADGVWCTDWDAQDSFDFPGAFADAYEAPLQTDDELFTSSEHAYPNTSGPLGLVGCTPGVTE